ncbi:GntR family transcriptional regulator [Ottowia sp.]|uniref:GntR family transcriptional regulator n=1 Tax=Ottowia sp. TaxID=1898956 RepID=UPI002C6F0F51|nr:GntR family transcriptional regulator [Ottowia sp.]HRN76145.1 GntR family transcriptional regulator [Ottowia sp.]HRQ03441.1 GntR family transcriptional regulator [Ottowia sp.]
MARPRLVLASTLQDLASLGASRPALAVRGAASSEIAGMLRRAIVNVDLVPGTALNESDVATQFGVSRTPVREAFRTLLSEGLLDVRPQKGTFVSLLHRPDLEDALFVREALECSAADLAARAPVSERMVLLRIVEQQRMALQQGDREGSLAADEDLHRKIMELSGHASAWEVVRQARTHLERLRRIANAELGGSEEALGYHEKIAQAIVDGDAKAAVQLLRSHIRQIEGFIGRIAELHAGYIG